LGRPADHSRFSKADVHPKGVHGYDGWICVGPLSDGEAKNRTFVAWLDRAEAEWQFSGDKERNRTSDDLIAKRKAARQDQGLVLVLGAGDYSMGTAFAAATRELAASSSYWPGWVATSPRSATMISTSGLTVAVAALRKRGPDGSHSCP
jgi:hypothetical protein